MWGHDFDRNGVVNGRDYYLRDLLLSSDDDENDENNESENEEFDDNDSLW